MKVEFMQSNPILGQFFPGMIGQEIFCPRCKSVLDCQTAAHVEVFAKTDGGEEHTVLSRPYCGKCKPVILANLEKLAEATGPKGEKYVYTRAEVIDGSRMSRMDLGLVV